MPAGTPSARGRLLTTLVVMLIVVAGLPVVGAAPAHADPDPGGGSDEWSIHPLGPGECAIHREHRPDGWSIHPLGPGECAIHREVGAGEVPPDTDWRSYVLAPDDRDVAPVAVLDTSDAVRDPEALLARGGGAATFERELTGGHARWPDGTTTKTSSAADGHGGAAAVDADPDTWWQDATPDAGPDALTVTAPREVRLPGVTVVSSSHGWVQDFAVETWSGGQWVRQGAVEGNDRLTRAVVFDHPVTTDRVRITVAGAWANPGFPLEQRERARVVEVVPGVVGAPYVDLDFGQVVAGRLRVDVAGASDPAPGVRIATSELRRNLSPRSDYSHSDYGPDGEAGGGDEGPGTDQFVPDSSGGTWEDDKGCQFGGQQDGAVCADGLRGFRYVRVYLGTAEGDGDHTATYGSVAIDAVRLHFTPYLGTPDTYEGYFLSGDDLLNRAWYASAYTVELVTETFAADNVDPRGCASPTLEGKAIYLDGAKRDRCPYGGGADVAMLATYLSHPDPAPITNQLADFASRQATDGWIPGSPIFDYSTRYQNSTGRWATELYKYVLYSGDLDFARAHWDNLVGVLDTWYPRVTNDRNLVMDHLALSSEAVLAYRNGAALAEYLAANRQGWSGTLPSGASEGRGAPSAEGAESPAGPQRNVRAVHRSQEAPQGRRPRGSQTDTEAVGGEYAAKAASWRAAADRISASVNAHLWDDEVGAYRQSISQGCHPQWNASVVLDGIAPPQRARRALDYLRTLARPWGNPYNDDREACPLFDIDTESLVYGEGGALETAARFERGRDWEALDQLRRTYGWQLNHDPGSTVWEGYGAPGGDPAGLFGRYFTSMAHGHMAGAAYVLTNQVLGVTPTGFGFDRYEVIPHPGDVPWARGAVPTPHGPIDVSWQREPRRDGFWMTLRAPDGTTGRIGIPTFGQRVKITVNGRTVWHGARSPHCTGHPLRRDLAEDCKITHKEDEDGEGGRRDVFGAHREGGYVYLEDVPAGTYEIRGRRVGPPRPPLDGVSATLTVEQQRAYPGETVRVTATVRNDSVHRLRRVELAPAAPGESRLTPVTAASTPRLGPGETFTARFDLTVARDQPPDETFELSGAASYRIAAETGSVGLRARLAVPSPVEMTSVTATPQGFDPGEGTTVAATVRNRSPVEVRGALALDVPDGWRAGPETAGYRLAPGESTAAEFTVTSPKAAPEASAEIVAVAGYAGVEGDRQPVQVYLVPAPTGTRYLSDLAWIEATSGHATVQRDTSVIGRPIILQGVTYAKGLGTHATSLIRYYLGANCARMTAEVGVDDAVGDNGTVTFQVRGDGEVLTDTGRMTGSSPTKQIDVDIGGVRVLDLVVTDAEDLNAYDHADWADATVECGGEKARHR